MSHFYGTIEGNRGRATRCGTVGSGMMTIAASWQGAVRVDLYDEKGVDMACVSLTPWEGRGISSILYEGPVSGKRRINNGKSQRKSKVNRV